MLTIINHTTPSIHMHNAGRRRGIRQALTGSATAELKQPIIEHFDEFMSKIPASNVQNNLAYEIAEKLVEADPSIPIKFERAAEECEIVFLVENQNAQNILVLDQDGDLMISHSPLKGEGWREFHDHGNVDPELVTYKFLSL